MAPVQPTATSSSSSPAAGSSPTPSRASLSASLRTRTRSAGRASAGGSRSASASPARKHQQHGFTLGASVLHTATGQTGTVRFVGETQFAGGEWVGVELSGGGGGKNDGAVQGVRYFACAPSQGLFVRPVQLRLLAGVSPTTGVSPIPGVSPTTGVSHNEMQQSPMVDGVSPTTLESPMAQHQIPLQRHSLPTGSPLPSDAHPHATRDNHRGSMRDAMRDTAVRERPPSRLKAFSIAASASGLVAATPVDPHMSELSAANLADSLATASSANLAASSSISLAASRRSRLNINTNSSTSLFTRPPSSASLHRPMSPSRRNTAVSSGGSHTAARLAQRSQSPASASPTNNAASPTKTHSSASRRPQSPNVAQLAVQTSSSRRSLSPSPARGRAPSPLQSATNTPASPNVARSGSRASMHNATTASAVPVPKHKLRSPNPVAASRANQASSNKRQSSSPMPSGGGHPSPSTKQRTSGPVASNAPANRSTYSLRSRSTSNKKHADNHDKISARSYNHISSERDPDGDVMDDAGSENYNALGLSLDTSTIPGADLGSTVLSPLTTDHFSESSPMPASSIAASALTSGTSHAGAPLTTAAPTSALPASQQSTHTISSASTDDLLFKYGRGSSTQQPSAAPPTHPSSSSKHHPLLSRDNLNQPSFALSDRYEKSIIDESIPLLAADSNNSLSGLDDDRVSLVANASQRVPPNTSNGNEQVLNMSRALAVDAASSGDMRADTVPVLTPAPIAAPANEHVVPLHQYEQLQHELQLLKEARDQDRAHQDNQRHMETNMTSLDSTIVALKDKYDRAQADVRDLRTRVRDLTDANARLEQDLARANDMMEMTLVDKEIAEEHVDVLKAEAKTHCERIEELALELDIARAEKDMLVNGVPRGEPDGDVVTGVGSDQPRVNLMQLELQNERLREALLKLRNVSLTNEHDLKSKMDAMQSDVEASGRLRDEYNRVKRDLDHALENIQDLKQHLDDALGSEELIQRLSDTNLRLGERITEMRAAIDELEELRRVNNELEEAHLESHKMLADEIVLKDSVLAEVGRHMSAQRDALKDSEYTIEKFRGLVRKLQDDLRQRPAVPMDPDQLKHQGDQSQQRVHDDLASQLRAATSTNMELRHAMDHASTRLADMQLKQLDYEQFAQELVILRKFLPDHYTRTEHDLIQCYLGLRRLDLASRMIGEYYAHLVGAADGVQLTHYAVYVDMCGACRGVSAHARRLWRALESTQDDDLHDKFRRLLHPLSEHNAALRGVLVTLHGDGSSSAHHDTLTQSADTIPIDHPRNLSTLLQCLDRLGEHRHQLLHHIELTVQKTRVDLVCDEARETITILDTIRIDMDIISHVFTMMETDTVVTDRGSMTMLMDRIPVHARLCRDAVENVVKHMSRLENVKSVPKVSIAERLVTAFERVSRIAVFTKRLRSRLRAMVIETRARRRDVTIDAIDGVVSAMVVDVLGDGVSGAVSTDASISVVESVVSYCQSAAMAIRDAASALDRAADIESFDQPFDLWTHRSSVFCADVSLGADLKHRIDDLDHQITDLTRELQIKRDQLGESAIQIDVLKNRLERYEKQSIVVKDVENDLVKARNDYQVCLDEVMVLRGQLDVVESENRELRKSVEGVGRGVLQHSMVSPGKWGSTAAVATAGGGVGCSTGLLRSPAQSASDVGVGISVSNLMHHTSSLSQHNLHDGNDDGSAGHMTEQFHASGDTNTMVDVSTLLDRLESQRKAIRYLSTLNARLSVTGMVSKMHELMHPGDPVTKRVVRMRQRVNDGLSECEIPEVVDVTGDAAARVDGSDGIDGNLASMMGWGVSASSAPTRTQRDKQVGVLRRMASKLADDVRRHELNVRVVDVAVYSDRRDIVSESAPEHRHRITKRKWTPLQNDPEMQMMARRHEAVELAERAERLRDVLSRVKIQRDDHPLLAHSGDDARRRVSNTSSSLSSFPVARVRVPAWTQRGMPALNNDDQGDGHADRGGRLRRRCIKIPADVRDLEHVHALFVM